MAKNVFHFLDFIVFGLTIVFSIGIGVFHACAEGKQKTTEEYQLGNRQMRVIPVSISILVTFVSSTTMLGSPAEMYAFGTQYALVVFGAALGTLGTAFLYVPLFYPLKLTSVFQYVDMRYKSRILRQLVALFFIINQFFLNGIWTFAPAIALEAVTEIPSWITIIICVIAATIYTSIGGIKAVVWADVFQSVVMLIGVLAVITLGTIKTGGATEVWRLNQEWDRIQFFNMNPDPTERSTFWSMTIVIGVLYFVLGATQHMVQRYMSVPTAGKARLSVLLNIPGFMISNSLCCACGIVVFAYYAKIGCDPIRAGFIRNPNQILPYFVVDVLKYPGVPGLFLACLTSAALSTCSTSLSSASTIVWKDFLSHKLEHLPESRKAFINKIVVGVVGIGAIAITFVIALMKGTLIQMTLTIAGAIIGPVIGCILLGATFPRVGPKASILGTMISEVFMIMLGVGANIKGAHSTALPTPVDNCNWIVSNFSHGLQSNGSLVPLSTIIPDSLVPTVPVTTAINYLVQEDHAQSGLQRLLSLSYVYYPAVGIMLTSIAGLLFSFIPGFQQQGVVPDKLLFVHVRVIRRWLGISTYKFQATEEDEDKKDMAAVTPLFTNHAPDYEEIKVYLEKLPISESNV